MNSIRITNDKDFPPQERVVAQAVHQGIGIPDDYRMDGLRTGF